MLSAAQRKRNRRKIQALRKFGTTSDRAINAPAPSDITAAKSAIRQKAQGAARKVRQAVKKREDRKIQLAKMPKGRGAGEYKRLAEGGALKETATEKIARQRKAQLAGMPKGRGKVDEKKILKVADSRAKQATAKQAAMGKAAAEAAKKKAAAEAAKKKAAMAAKHAALTGRGKK